MSLKDITLKYETEEDNRDSVEDYRIILKLEEKIRTLQAKNSELEDKLFEYGMGLLSSDEVEALKARDELLESENASLLKENEDLKVQLSRIVLLESENKSLSEALEHKDNDIGKLLKIKEDLINQLSSKQIKRKAGRPAKYAEYYDLIFSLYQELQSLRKVHEELEKRGINLSHGQVQYIVKKMSVQ